MAITHNIAMKGPPVVSCDQGLLERPKRQLVSRLWLIWR